MDKSKIKKNTTGKRRQIENLVIILDGRFDIKYVHQIEKVLDHALTKVGFIRTETSKENNKTILNYKQYISVPE